MPHVSKVPVVSTIAVNDLRNAVARWDYEGGAGLNGPQEGYRVSSVDAGRQGEQLDRLVRLLIAALAIRAAGREPLNRG